METQADRSARCWLGPVVIRFSQKKLFPAKRFGKTAWRLAARYESRYISMSASATFLAIFRANWDTAARSTLCG